MDLAIMKKKTKIRKPSHPIQVDRIGVPRQEKKKDEKGGN